MMFLRKTFVPMAMIIIGLGYSGAYFSDNVMIPGNTFTTGVWNPGKATITEVLYNPTSPPADTSREWIEITNTGGLPLDMGGYVLHFDGNSHAFTFPTFSLLAGSKVVVHVRAAGSNSATELYWSDTNNLNMGNEYGSVGLYRALPKEASTITDYIEYGSGGNDGEPKAATAGIWTAGAFVPLITTEGSSMGLISVDNNLASDWIEQSVPTPGV